MEPTPADDKVADDGWIPKSEFNREPRLFMAGRHVGRHAHKMAVPR